LRFRKPIAQLLSTGIAVMLGAVLVAAAIEADAQWFEDHWFSSYCTRSPLAPALEATVRFLAGAAGVALVTRVRSRIVTGTSPMSLGPLLRRCGAILVAAVLALVVSDGILRMLHKERTIEEDRVFPPMTIDGHHNVIEPLRSHTKDVTFGKRVVRYATDADGNRVASVGQVSDLDAPTILFTGESVAIGWGVPYERSFSAIVAATLQIQAVNVAVAGFANDQAYLRGRDALAKLTHPLAWVTIAVSEQIERNVRPTRQHLALSSDGRLELVSATTSLWATSPLRRLVGYHSAEAIPLTRAILQATIDVSRARGAIPIFVWTNYGPPCVPSEHGMSPLEERLFSGLEAAHVRVDIPPEQTLAGSADAHPNEKGHETLARSVLEALREASVLPPR